MWQAVPCFTMADHPLRRVGRREPKGAQQLHRQGLVDHAVFPDARILKVWNVVLRAPHSHVYAQVPKDFGVGAEVVPHQLREDCADGLGGAFNCHAPPRTSMRTPPSASIRSRVAAGVARPLGGASHCAGARRLVGFLVFGGTPMFMKMPCEGVETLIMHAGAGGRFRGALGRLGVDGRRATAAGHAVVTGTPTAALD